MARSPNPFHKEAAGWDPAAQPKPQAPATLSSQDLLRGENTVTIEHNGTVYRLQSTRAGKLILTK